MRTIEAISSGSLIFLERYLQKIRHLDIKFHYVKNKAQDRTIQIKKISLSKMKIDFVTKVIQYNVHYQAINTVGMIENSDEKGCQDIKVFSIRVLFFKITECTLIQLQPFILL